MTTNDKDTKQTFSKIALLQGFAFIFLSFFAGVVYPLFSVLVQGPEEAASWKESLILWFRWYWTLPVGIILAILTIWISNKLKESARAIFGLIISLVLLAFALFLTWLMLYA